jgi:hypothetical protein
MLLPDMLPVEALVPGVAFPCFVAIGPPSRSLSLTLIRYTFPVASPIISFEKSFENAPVAIPPERVKTFRTKAFPAGALMFHAFTFPSDDPV